MSYKPYNTVWQAKNIAAVVPSIISGHGTLYCISVLDSVLNWQLNGPCCHYTNFLTHTNVAIPLLRTLTNKIIRNGHTYCYVVPM